MPCITYEPPEEKAPRELDAQEQAIAPFKNAIAAAEQKLSERDAMLCGVLSALHSLDDDADASCTVNGADMKFSAAVEEYFDWEQTGVDWSQVMQWWTDHQEADRRRKEAEQILREVKRRKILARLTDEEREILGV